MCRILGAGGARAGAASGPSRGSAIEPVDLRSELRSDPAVR